jgi:hypothetical protein
MSYLMNKEACSTGIHLTATVRTLVCVHTTTKLQLCTHVVVCHRFSPTDEYWRPTIVGHRGLPLPLVPHICHHNPTDGCCLGPL